MTKSELIEKIAKDAGIPNSKAKIAFEFQDTASLGKLCDTFGMI